MAQTENTGLFEIKDGILTKYHGRQKNVVIPEGVTAMALRESVRRHLPGVKTCRTSTFPRA